MSKTSDVHDSLNVTHNQRHDVQASYQARRSRSLALIERMLRSYLRPYLPLLGLSIVANVIVAATTGALPWFIQMAIDEVFNGKNETMLLLIPVGVIAVSIIKSLATYASNVIMNFVGQGSTANLQRDLFARLMRGDLAYVSTQHSGAYISIFMNDATRLRDTVSGTIIAFARHLLTIVALIAFMFTINWHLALIYTIIVVPMGLVSMRRLGKVTRSASRQGLEETSELSTFIVESLTGLRIVKAYGQEDQQISRARATIDRVLDYTMRALRARAAASPAIEGLAGFAVGAIIYVGGYQSMQGNLTAGEFMGFITALLAVYQPLRSVANIQTILQEGVSAGTRVFSILDQKDAILDTPNAKPLKIENGEISFDQVSFQYAGRDIPALNDVSIHVPAGKTVALVGQSGSGKSTLLNLVLRFFDVSGGQIQIDGQDIRSVDLNSLRRATALVTQDPFLFDDTIANNISYGKQDFSQADIEQAAKQAAAHEFIVDMPEGYQTRVGESGLRLSGGQKQRIAIARAMLKDAPILLLDEATSALDTASEQKVQTALTQLMKGRTSLVIAHRLSTIMHADEIFVMREGQVVEHGTHTQLLDKRGVYADLYERQFDNGNG
ncbi:MAG: ATP-binding cassette domain-containing protein [Rhodobiaceae bacterium]|nr:ATP-binding cassette domain-containing protein [Rhodobiaceae bacterium]MBT5518761.1 ATP-binding cassette domain-containing protein [Rhodobiaceae bacterium]MBT7280173.1 ATP-binding cassette domain-containing protein [Rhodobiaceae bacterium]MDG2495485.1 ABC transporter transmembrane domain-containing protein [Alphaproteobacteria bacterium]